MNGLAVRSRLGRATVATVALLAGVLVASVPDAGAVPAPIVPGVDAAGACDDPGAWALANGAQLIELADGENYDGAGSLTPLAIVAGDDGATIRGSAFGDLLCGGAGDDKLFGEDGDDLLFGGPGDDHLQGQNGADAADGGAGDDRVHGNDGDDVLTGGDDRDKVVGGDGEDTCVTADGERLRSCEIEVPPLPAGGVESTPLFDGLTAPAIEPTVNCVRTLPDGRQEAVLGYVTAADAPIRLARVGPNNWIDGHDQVQPTFFWPGSHPEQFAVRYDPYAPPTWNLTVPDVDNGLAVDDVLDAGFGFAQWTWEVTPPAGAPDCDASTPAAFANPQVIDDGDGSTDTVVNAWVQVAPGSQDNAVVFTVPNVATACSGTATSPVSPSTRFGFYDVAYPDDDTNLVPLGAGDIVGSLEIDLPLQDPFTLDLTFVDERLVADLERPEFPPENAPPGAMPSEGYARLWAIADVFARCSSPSGPVTGALSAPAPPDLFELVTDAGGFTRQATGDEVQVGNPTPGGFRFR